MKELRLLISIDRINGIVMLTASTPTLQQWGVALSKLGTRLWNGMDYTELDWDQNDGEVQIFERFGDMVRTSTRVRAELFPSREHEELSAEERERIYARIEAERLIA